MFSATGKLIFVERGMSWKVGKSRCFWFLVMYGEDFGKLEESSQMFRKSDESSQMFHATPRKRRKRRRIRSAAFFERVPPLQFQEPLILLSHGDTFARWLAAACDCDCYGAEYPFFGGDEDW